MRVLIVSKTHMGNMACVGGLVVDTSENIRLLQPNNFNQPADTSYEVGSLWNLDYYARREVIAPHVEDVIVRRSERIGLQPNLREFLLSRIRPWTGSPQQLFNGLLGFTANGSGYISRNRGLPPCSVGFWVPDSELRRIDQQNRIKYRYTQGIRNVYVSYVGFQPTEPIIPRGSLVRVSLARWWRPDDAPELEERCYLQLSGWYDLDDAHNRNDHMAEDELIQPDDDIPF